MRSQTRASGCNAAKLFVASRVDAHAGRRCAGVIFFPFPHGRCMYKAMRSSSVDASVVAGIVAFMCLTHIYPHSHGSIFVQKSGTIYLEDFHSDKTLNKFEYPTRLSTREKLSTCAYRILFSKPKIQTNIVSGLQASSSKVDPSGMRR